MKIFIQRIFPLVFFTLYLCSAKAQNKTIDSLKKVLVSQQEDTNKVNTLIKLGRNFRLLNDSSRAIQCAKEALLLAEKINYKKRTG